jgi:DNA-binding GntR family transcriptional regulator
MTEIVRDRVSDQVHRYLRDKIIDGKFEEGRRLVEVEIASELGVSRTPVREALWQLRSMHLVRSVGTAGYEVTNIRQELADVLDIRAALEAHAVRKAAAAVTREQLENLTNICDRMEKLSPGASAERAELNRCFHEELIRARGNRRLLQMVGEYQDYFTVAQPMFDKSFIARTQREHRQILDALRVRDGDKAAELITQHILGAAKFLQAEKVAAGAE